MTQPVPSTIEQASRCDASPCDWAPSKTAKLLERARLAREAGAARRATGLLSAALTRRLAPKDEARLRCERARAWLALREWQSAERDSRRALRLGLEEGRSVLLRSLAGQNRFEEVVSQFDDFALHSPTAAASWSLYASALSGLGRHHDSVAAARRAYELESSRAHEVASAMMQAGQHDANIVFLRQAVHSTSDDVRLWVALGTSLSAVGRSVEAVEAFREAVRLEPEHQGANWGLGNALLRLGEYSEGFRYYEYRQKAAGHCRRLAVPPWRGESLKGKSLTVRVEQGFGDTIQFVRFMPLVRELAARTVLLCATETRRLLSSNSAFGRIECGHPGFGTTDYQTLAMSLPRHLGVPDSIERAPVPYLFPERPLVEFWRRALPAGPKIALAWQGNPAYAGDRWRSMPFKFLEPLIAQFRGRYSFLSLQKGFGTEQLSRSPLAASVVNLSGRIDTGGDAFVDSLAILSVIDLFITTDTGLAHLAGAAGVRTCLLLGTVPDWRWGVESLRTPWYPSLQLFRQLEAGCWAPVVARLIASLGEQRRFDAVAFPTGC